MSGMNISVRPLSPALDMPMTMPLTMASAH